MGFDKVENRISPSLILYAKGAKPQFVEGNPFITVIPLPAETGVKSLGQGGYLKGGQLPIIFFLPVARKSRYNSLLSCWKIGSRPGFSFGIRGKWGTAAYFRGGKSAAPIIQ